MYLLLLLLPWLLLYYKKEERIKKEYRNSLSLLFHAHCSLDGISHLVYVLFFTHYLIWLRFFLSLFRTDAACMKLLCIALILCWTENLTDKQEKSSNSHDIASDSSYMFGCLYHKRYSSKLSYIQQTICLHLCDCKCLCVEVWVWEGIEKNNTELARCMVVWGGGIWNGDMKRAKTMEWYIHQISEL